jgi:hypothetical protein
MILTVNYYLLLRAHYLLHYSVRLKLTGTV